MPEKLEIMEANCPHCGGMRRTEVLADHNVREADERAQVWADTAHRILRCMGCSSIVHQTDYTFSEDVEYFVDPFTGEEHYHQPVVTNQWPSPAKREIPDWLDEIGNRDIDLFRLLHETYTALDNDLWVLAAIGLRTAFDRATELVGVDAAISFAEKLQALEDEGFIGVSEKDTLTTLTNAGSAAAHRGWRPSLAELATMAAIVEGFLHRNFILNAQARQLNQTVPPRPPRRRRTNKPAS